MTKSSSPDRVELRPCPFCGAIPHMEFSHEAGRWDIYELECPCGISVYGPCGHEGDDAKNATARKWNTRPESESVTVMREALEEVLAVTGVAGIDAASLRLNIRSIAREALARIGGSV